MGICATSPGGAGHAPRFGLDQPTAKVHQFDSCLLTALNDWVRKDILSRPVMAISKA